MGARDTKEDASRLAVESAKRNALEQVILYLESVTVMDGMNVTKDEIRTYTAGMVMVRDQRMTTAVDGEAVVVKADLVAQIDTEEAARAITALRKNEEARGQLAALQRENERLRHELEGANRALADAATPDQSRSAARQRREILHRVQSNAMVSQAWTDWALVPSAPPAHASEGKERLQLLLRTARDLYPANPYVVIAELAMAAQQPPKPRLPPAPPAPGQAPGKMPTYEIVSHPGSRDAPRTLNELVYRTPGWPSHDGGESPAPQGARPQAESDEAEKTGEERGKDQ